MAEAEPESSPRGHALRLSPRSCPHTLGLRLLPLSLQDGLQRAGRTWGWGWSAGRGLERAPWERTQAELSVEVGGAGLAGQRSVWACVPNQMRKA